MGLGADSTGKRGEATSPAAAGDDEQAASALAALAHPPRNADGTAGRSDEVHLSLSARRLLYRWRSFRMYIQAPYAGGQTPRGGPGLSSFVTRNARVRGPAQTSMTPAFQLSRAWMGVNQGLIHSDPSRRHLLLNEHEAIARTRSRYRRYSGRGAVLPTFFPECHPPLPASSDPPRSIRVAASADHARGGRAGFSHHSHRVSMASV